MGDLFGGRNDCGRSINRFYDGGMTSMHKQQQVQTAHRRLPNAANRAMRMLSLAGAAGQSSSFHLESGHFAACPP
ncbi:hypothetical protein ACEN9F_31050 [Duganella sp. CT11-25]|uniref:hypothetical protein n=1 Tax=unclassified Duganella TaxID=2636909 RepID=UPI0039B0129C